MRDYIARAKVLVMKLEQNDVSTTKKEINRRILNGLPSEFDVEKKMFLLMTDTDPDELGKALTRVEDSRTKNGGAGGAHALATGAKPRGGGQGRGGVARRDRGGRGNARGRRDGKGQHHHHQQQWASQPLVQQQQQWASQPPAQQQQWASQPPAQQQQWASQPPAQQKQPQTHQRQPPQRQLQQQQRPPGHSGGWGPSCVCFRCGQPGQFYAKCRAVPPAPYITPQGDQQADYSSPSPGDYASSSGEHRHLTPTPPAPQGTPASSDSSWSFSTERAVMTQFCPPGESVDWSGFVSNSSARIVPNGAFASQSHKSRSDFWIGDSGASCHMTNDASKMYCMRPPHFGITYQRGILASISLEIFADADCASKATDRRSVSGGTIMCGGACVCWFSRTEKCVTLSTSEAEYIALGDAVKELLFLRQVWRFMLPGQGMPCFPIFEDNQGAVQLSQNPVSNSNSKPIDVRHHFLRELVPQGDISVSHVSSEYQYADILTKALALDVSRPLRVL